MCVGKGRPCCICLSMLQWRKCSTRCVCVCVCVCVCWGEIMSAVWAFFQGVDRRYAKSIMQHLQSRDNARRVPRQVIQYHKFDYVIWKTATQKYTNNGRKLTLVTLGGRQKRKQRSWEPNTASNRTKEDIGQGNNDQGNGNDCSWRPALFHSEGPRVPTADRAYWTPQQPAKSALLFQCFAIYSVTVTQVQHKVCVCVCVCVEER